MPVHILYADDFFCVCEKPVGVSSESSGMPELIRRQTGKKTYPVHRLDQGTGGILILAFSSESCSSLQHLLQQDLVRKEYLAVVPGRLSDNAGVYRDLLYHDKMQNKTFVVSCYRKGVKEASCEWNALQSAGSEDTEFSLVKVILHTGRTHQIRVQFASRGFPLAGDRKYGSRIKLGSPALWSYRVRFPHPFIQDRDMDISVLPPESFPWNLFHFSGL